jgi:hypothetical protein
VAVLRDSSQSDVYLAQPQQGGISTPRRLTLDDRDDLPASWTTDSKRVLFTSFRNGDADVFIQDVDSDTAVPFVAGPGYQGEPQVTADGEWVLYSASAPGVRGKPDRIVRVPVEGGDAMLVMQSDAYVRHSCSLSGPCFVVERTLNQDTVSLLEPFNKGRELLKIREVFSPDAINISPDGTRMAYVVPTGLPRRQIRVIRLDGTVDHDITVAAARHIRSLDWAADGRSFYAGDVSLSGFSLLEIDATNGEAKILWKGEGCARVPRAIPSRDGNQLAIRGGSR